MPSTKQSKLKRAPPGARRVRNLKALALKIDTEELSSIRARGRAAFARHEELRSIVRKLKERRLSQGMSLSVVARAIGMAKSNLSRLENSDRTTPTLDTLERYARALGMTIRVSLAAAADVA